MPKKQSGWVGIALPKELIEIIDKKLVGYYGYRSRQDVVVDAVRQLLREMGFLPKIRVEVKSRKS